MDLSSEHPARLEALFDEALEMDTEARRAYLDHACVEDPGLRIEVESLLAALEAHGTKVRRLLEGLSTPAPPRSPAEPVRGAYDSHGLTGRLIGQYHILGTLGGGGMGVVYKARDLRLDRIVALKFLPPYLSADEQAKARLIHEAKTASALDHANICAIHDIGDTEQGQLFIVMACYDGETLKAKIAGGRLSVCDALDYATQVARGLAKTHAAGIVHRDIKPANLLVTTDGEVKILDFGIAKAAGVGVSEAGVPEGTVNYMSPEQVYGRDVDHRADLWALGTVLYEMLTGERPFRGEHPQAVIDSILRGSPQPIREARPEVSEALARIVGTLLQKDPDARYRTAEELVVDLGSLRGDGNGVHAEAGRTSPAYLHPLRLVRSGSLAAVALVVATLGLLVWRQEPQPASAFPPVPLESRRSIAVLPLESRSGGEEQALFAEGITDELTAMLTRIEGLRVLPRQSVLRYQQGGRLSADIARQLQVDYIVNGSMLWAGNEARISVNLIDPAVERPVWSRSFVDAQRDVVGLQQEVVRAIVQELEGKLTREDEARLGQARPVNPRAYELFRKGRHLHSRPGEPRTARIQTAKSYFEQAIALDPSYAAAHAWLGREYFALGLYRVLSWEDAMPAAQRHLAMALMLDETSADAYALKGSLLQITGEWTAAEEALRRAIESNPGESDHYCDLALLLIRRGRLREASELAGYALRLNPVSFYPYQVGVQAYVYAREYDEAIALSRKVLELYPEHWAGHWGLGLAYLGLGLNEESLAVLEGAAAADSRMLAPLGYAYAALGRRREAHEVVDALKARGLSGDLDNMYVSRIHIALAEREAALDWLERFGQADYYMADPAFDPLRSEPRFQALLKRVGLEG